MSFSKPSLEQLVELFVKCCNSIEESIYNIQNKETFDEIKRCFTTCQLESQKIERLIDDTEDISQDLIDKYNSKALIFDANKSGWEKVLKKKELELERLANSAELANMTEDQILEMQKKEEEEYYKNQIKEIIEKKESIKYWIIKQCPEKRNELDKFEDDKKNDENDDEYLDRQLIEIDELNKMVDAIEKDFSHDYPKVVRFVDEDEQKTTETQSDKNDQEDTKKCSIC